MNLTGTNLQHFRTMFAHARARRPLLSLDEVQDGPAGKRRSRRSATTKTSLDTVKDCGGYLEAAFLAASLPRWTTSRAERIYTAKKLSLCDTGLKTVLTGPGDEGARAENAVFMELRRRGIPAGYFAESQREVDFVTGSPADPVPIEVKLVGAGDLTDRRFAGLTLFLKRHPEARRAVIVTRGDTSTRTAGDVTVEATPLWSFLLHSGRYI